MGNSYFKKDYSKGEVNVVQIAQIRLQKMKKHVAMAIFYYLISKIWKNNILCFCKKGKNTWFVLFLKCKKLT